MALDPNYLNDINGSSDPTQSVNAPKRNLSTAGVAPMGNAPDSAANPPRQISSASGADGGAAAATNATMPAPDASTSVWDNFSPGAATGLNAKSFATVQDAAQRATAAAQNKADNTTMYGDPSKYIAGSKPPVDLSQPTASVFSPDASQPTALNPLGRPTDGVQPQVVPPITSVDRNIASASSGDAIAPVFNPTAADLAADGALRNSTGSMPPGAAGAMTGMIPAVTSAATPDVLPAMTVTPSTASNSAALAGTSNNDAQSGDSNFRNPNRFAGNAIADGGVKAADGSLAFSNMPGKLGYMDPSQVQDLGDRTNTISDQNFVNPGLGTNGYTPTSDQGVSSIAYRGLNNAIDAARADNQQSRNDALSDIYSMADQDPRSVSGTAARNAAIDLKSNLESAGRYAHGRNIAGVQQAAIDQYKDSIGAAPGMLSEGMRDEAGTNDDAVRGLTSLGAASLTNDARLNAAEARAEALYRGWGLRADATRDAATTNAGAKVDAATITANRQRLNPSLEHGVNVAYTSALNSPDNPGTSMDEKIAYAQKAATAYRTNNSGVGAPQPGGSSQPQASSGSTPSLQNFMVAARARNPNVSDADLQAYYAKKYQQ